MDFDFSQLRPGPWYPSIMFDETRAMQLVNMYLRLIYEQFPVVSIDEETEDNGNLAQIYRRSWSGRFRPRDHTVSINASKFHSMVESQGRGIRFRSYLFLFANYLVHEIGGHLFITFMNNGNHDPRAQTPPHIASELPGFSSFHRGESGQRLECLLFGGILEADREINRDDGEIWVPYIIKREDYGENIGFRVLQRAIDDTINYSEHLMACPQNKIALNSIM
ncbi:hypothetical protein ACLMJK_009588 [Lecanora helva]